MLYVPRRALVPLQVSRYLWLISVCGYAVQSPGAPTASSECNYACTGDSSQSCGGAGRLNLFASGSSAPSAPQTVAEDWEYQGCYTDSVSDRTLSHSHHVDGGMTIESCVAFCSANEFSFAGLEFGDECCESEFVPMLSLFADAQCYGSLRQLPWILYEEIR